MDFLVFLLVVVLVFMFWASRGSLEPGWYPGEIRERKKATRTISSPTGDQHPLHRLKIMTWNIGYAYGMGSGDRTGYQRKAKETFVWKLRKIGEFIREQSPDVVLLQEVDFAASRSHGMDQLELLSEYSGLDYSGAAMTWKNTFVPFPYWPPGHQFRGMLSGAGVLSRHPILNNQVLIHQKPKGNAWWYNLFYIGRFSQVVEVALPGGDQVAFINNHLEAFQKENRAYQSGILAKLVEKTSREKKLIAFGGDLNSVPQGAKKLKNFIDDNRDDYEEDPTLETLGRLSSFREVISDDEYQRNESKYFTFPCNDPSRRLDYLYVNRNWNPQSVQIPRPSEELSDHLPLVVEVERALLC